MPAARGSAFGDTRVVRSVVAGDHAPGTYVAWPARTVAASPRSSRRSRWGFFLRAGTMHGYYSYLNDVGGELALVHHWRRYLDEPMRCLRLVL